MKNLSMELNSVWRIVLIGFTLFLLTNCSDEGSFQNVETGPQLKAFNMLHQYQVGPVTHYEGQVNNDLIEILVPANWNGQFIVYAHGYVDPNKPLALPDDEIDGTPLKQLIISQGFAYASSSYSQNGFAVKEAVIDIIFLGNMIKAHFKPDKIILGGVSEGGLVALKTLERNQNTFDGGLIACGPIGDFDRQLQYFGNFHVLFNYLYAPELAFASIDLGSPAYVPPTTMEAWSAGLLDLPLTGVVTHDVSKLPVLFELAQIPPFPPGPTPTLVDSLLVIKDILRFNIMATNDLIQRVNGIPFDNTEVIYSGTILPGAFYTMLNAAVTRIDGDKQAVKKVESLYETSGLPSVPVVLMHTLGDHVTPVWHLDTYLTQKVDPARIGSDIKFYVAPVKGHCNFTPTEILMGIQEILTILN